MRLICYHIRAISARYAHISGHMLISGRLAYTLSKMCAPWVGVPRPPKRFNYLLGGGATTPKQFNYILGEDSCITWGWTRGQSLVWDLDFKGNRLFQPTSHPRLDYP